ncbi:hypothetical protein KSS93_13170 [Pseudomonas xanthosomatis]|uniref:hypothetical protein n=1 Tax=Pseudomonas xanthosomatis TaxID=2842356 RepID=UPI001C3D07FA|nr:hypothetical protein [Pseudomonas xanthosomatis]QXH48790.1 hypothetical protein KSS93_13170 [Pseudomonas xanthosomatis]
MKLLGLILLALIDVRLRLALNKYVFKDMMRAWQFWGELIYATCMAVIYFEIMAGKGVIEFQLETMHMASFWIMTTVTGAMIIFHALAFTHLFDRWRR